MKKNTVNDESLPISRNGTDAGVVNLHPPTPQFINPVHAKQCYTDIRLKLDFTTENQTLE